METQTILAGDIGGTKTTLALYGTTTTPLLEKTYQNSTFSSLQEIVRNFLSGQEAAPERACFGVAGPVHENRVQMTNLDWLIDGKKLGDHFSIQQVVLVNDLVATTAGAVTLPDDSLITINQGHPAPGGTIAVLAPGTGLGQSFAVPLDKGLQPFPSEGGHASFAPRNREQIELLEFMMTRYAHVSVERVCSGNALPDLYAFAQTRFQEPKWMAQRLAAADDQTPIIVHAANQARSGGPPCEPSVHALQLFVDILAAEAANLALKVLSLGGIYLGGGLPPRILSFFDPEQFMEIFRRGVYREMLADIPIQIIKNPRTALLGARQIALMTTTLPMQ